jgi:hypothetical protein
LINPHRLAYAVFVLGAGILPSLLGLGERQFVGRVAVNLICGHMNKRRDKTARRLQEVDRTHGVRVKVLERHVRGKIVTRLRCIVHDGRRAQLIDQAQHTGSVADIQFVMLKVRKLRLESTPIPARIALRLEKYARELLSTP